MKNSTIRTTILAAFLLAGLTSFATSGKTGNIKYEINPVENLKLGKTVEKVWTIAYSEIEKPVTITMHKHGKYSEFIVRSDFFEVVYSSTEEGFGAKCIKSSERTVKAKICSGVLNQKAMERQQIITQNPVSDELALGLIASYLPDLLNKGYEHLIF
ncbi:MAG: hypothetical protein WAO52_13380 [Prolixibacteraceae bacterium]